MMLHKTINGQDFNLGDKGILLCVLVSCRNIIQARTLLWSNDVINNKHIEKIIKLGRHVCFLQHIIH